MIRTYDFKLKPSKSQSKHLEDILDASRWIYNWALEDRKNLWSYCRVSTGFCDQSKLLKDFKKEKPSIALIHSHILQTTLKRLDLAFQAFFRRLKEGEKPGYPRFKGKHFFNSFSFKEYGNGFKLQGKRLKISGVGRVRIRLHRNIEGEIKTCTIKKQADGWHAFFGVLVTIPVLEQRRNDSPIGVDLGLDSFAVLSNGEKIRNPRLLKKSMYQIKREQRNLSRKTFLSSRWIQNRHRLAKTNLKVANQRKDFHFKTAKDLTNRFNPIIIEKLDIRGLIKKAVQDKKQHKKIRAKSENILDAAWGMFVMRLKSSAERAISSIKEVEPRGTSQSCSGCGEVVKKGLEERVHSCPKCGLVMDRDENASNNILSRGITDRACPSAMESGSRLTQKTREAAPIYG